MSRRTIDNLVDEMFEGADSGWDEDDQITSLPETLPTALVLDCLRESFSSSYTTTAYEQKNISEAFQRLLGERLLAITGEEALRNTWRKRDADKGKTR